MRKFEGKQSLIKKIYTQVPPKFSKSILLIKDMADKKGGKKRKGKDVKHRKESTPDDSDIDTTLEETDIEQENEGGDFTKHLKDITRKLGEVDRSIAEIKVRMGNVMTKDDRSIRQTIQDFLQQMKDELLASVNKNIEVLESRLFDREREHDELRERVGTLERKIESQAIDVETLKKEIMKKDEARRKAENEMEQYSRRNNLIISGVEDDDPDESAEGTAKVVIKMLEENKIYNLSMSHIDIAHRLPSKPGKRRDIIVKLVSRNTKIDILKNRRNLKGKGIFINENLSKLNFTVYMCVKRKMKDEVSQVWTRNGTIMYRDKADGVHTVKFEDYDEWLDLPWPAPTAPEGSPHN